MKRTEESSHPMNAEKYRYRDFVKVTTVFTESKIVEGLSSQEDKDFFICPGCGNSSDILEPMIVYECDCGISVQHLGFTLYLWSRQGDPTQSNLGHQNEN